MNTLRNGSSDQFSEAKANCEEDEILVCWDGSNAGEFFQAPNQGVLANTLGKISVCSDVDQRFVFYFLKSQEKTLRENLVGMGIPHVNPRNLENIRVPDHSRHTQTIIADFLDRETARVDSLINARGAFERRVLERRDSFLAIKLTGTISCHPWLREISGNWKSERAKIHFTERQDLSKTGTEELLTVSHISGVTKRAEKSVNMFMAETHVGYKMVRKNDLVINTMWAWMGAMGISPENGLISPSYGVYQLRSNALLAEFVDLLVRSKPFIAEATRRSKGIHSSRLRLYPDAFLDMPLPIPPKEQQHNILKDLHASAAKEDELLAANKRSIDLLREFRSGLITAAVTGQIDVTTWRKSGEAERRLDTLTEAHA